MRQMFCYAAFVLVALTACGSNGQLIDGSTGPDLAAADAVPSDLGALDAALPDAALPDAALPDAALPDAALPDAALPDATAQDTAQDAAPSDGTADSATPLKIKVLFIGNSYVAANGLPSVVAKISQATQSPISVTATQHTPGGARWEDHDASATATQLISQGWDYVVLQDQSQQPWLVSSLKPSLISLDAKIKAAKAKTLLFMTWARSAAVAANAAQLFRMQMAVNRYYEAHAEAVKATSVPVGRAWERAQRTSGATLHAPDGSHPNVQGTYLAACSLYIALSGQSPVGLGLGGLALTAKQAATLQQAAWETHLARRQKTSPLVAHWPLANKSELADFVPTSSLVVGGVSGPSAGSKATQFGTDKYAAVPYQPHLRVLKGLTLAYYAHRSDWSLPLVQGLTGKWWGYQIYQSQTTLNARVNTVNTAAPALITYNVSNLTKGWHHFALTYDGTTYALWVDAVKVASATTSGALRYYVTSPAEMNVHAGVALGGVPQGTSPSIRQYDGRFSGALRDVRLYDRALTQAELKGI